MKVKSFFFMHSNSDGEHDSIPSLERSFFEFRCKVSSKQLSITQFFHRIGSFNEVLYPVIANKQKQ
jgi:hypothetical protein